MASRKGTLKRKQAQEMGSYNISSGNFWDIGYFEKCVKRIPESSALCDDLVKMFAERADIESKYGKKLDDWHEKWSKYLEVSCMYATMKTAALGTLKEAKDRAVMHMDYCMKIQNQVIETIKRYKDQNYHHKMLGIKEAKDFESEFQKAQKPWAVAFNKVQRAKSNYHGACKQRDAAATNLRNANNDNDFPPEKIKKLEESLRKIENTVSTLQQKYDEKLKRISPLNVSYESDMINVYERWAKGEENRKEFLQRTLVEYHKCINIYSDPRLKELYDNQINVAYSGKAQYDVSWWGENFGASMPRNWPKFEEFGEEVELAQSQLTSAVNPPCEPTRTHSNPQQENGGLKAQQQVPSYQQPQQSQANPFVNGGELVDDDEDEWDAPPSTLIPGGGVPVRALYDYNKIEDDELSFQAGDIFTKLTEEDEQGWCRGRFKGNEGLYPANYAEQI